MEYRASHSIVKWSGRRPVWSDAAMPTLFAAALLALPLLQAAAAAPPLDDVRALTSAGSNDARFEAVTKLLEARGVPFAVEPFTPPAGQRRDPRTSGRNIVVTIGAGREHVLIGAHYDAVHFADGSMSPGAVDNAASAVVLVRLAAALRRDAPPIAVRLVWFDMEEGGLIGSQQYAAAHAADRPLAMLNFDINGYGETVMFGQPQGSKAPALDRAMALACAAEALDCLRFPAMPPGDDRTFGKAGIPALSIAVLPAIEAHQAWLTFNAREKSGLAAGATLPIMQTIHTPNDTLEKVQPAAIDQQVRLAAALVRQLAAAPR
jgi:Zn-dependent M28 family amino/carboxypeptidase